MRLTTTRGYDLSEVVSAMQKAIRRGDARVAGYFAIEMFESNFTAYAWRRLMTVSAEDCYGSVTGEIESLYNTYKIASQGKAGKGRIFLAKAVIVLCQCPKSRDADHLTNLVYDSKSINEASLDAALNEARDSVEPIPDYAFDCHTLKGKRLGKTKKDFFAIEHDALTPRTNGLFDVDVELLRSGDIHIAAKR